MSITGDHPRHRHPGGRRTAVLAIGRVLAGVLSFGLLLAFGNGWYEYQRQLTPMRMRGWAAGSSHRRIRTS